MDTKGMVTLNSVVSNAMLELDHPEEWERFRLYQFAIRGMREINLLHMKAVKTARLQMTEINTVILPDDFISFVALGTVFNGRFWVFTRDKKLMLSTTEDCGEENLDTDKTHDIGSAPNLQMYGLPGGSNQYYYTMDLPNNRIIINGFPRGEVILKYISSGVSLDKETLVPAVAEDCLIAYIIWKREKGKKDVPQYHKEMLARDFYREVDKLRFINGPSLDEIYDAIYESFIQTAKR